MSNSDNEQDDEFQPHPSSSSSHHPSAPLHESFDVSTTVDPSYVISLIRKLLPSNIKDGQNAVEGGLIQEEIKADDIKESTINLRRNGEDEAMESSEYGKVDEAEPIGDNENHGGSEGEAKLWEECGCVLWDLAASEDHAQFMVQNLILEVLLANLMVFRSSRITEISLGIIGNLACHEIPRKQIAATDRLVSALVDQLRLDDVPCLCEACRVLTLCLQGGEGVIWAEVFQGEEILSRILWIAENALNPLLIEKSVGLVLAILESRQEVAAILLPPMLNLDLSSVLIKLFAFEMSKFKGERVPDRYAVLDLILRTIEALSILDDYSQEICLNKELLQLVKELIEFPDKFEIASSCVTAAVLVANILNEATDLASELSKDVNFLQGLFDVFPFASDDTEAQNAIWSVIARLLTLVKESEMGPSMFHVLVSILASKLDLIEDELLVHPLESSRVFAMKRIFDILTRWKSLDNEIKKSAYVEDYYINEEDVDKLLVHICEAFRSDRSL